MFQRFLFSDESDNKSDSPGKNVTFSITPREFEGLKYISKLISSHEDENDNWLCYEVRGHTNLAYSLFRVY